MIVVADPERSFRQRIVDRLDSRHEVEEVAQSDKLENVLATHGHDGTILIVGPGIPDDEALELSNWLQLRGSAVTSILVTDALTTELLREAMRSGFKDVLPESFSDEQFAETLDRSETLAESSRRSEGPEEAATPDEPSKVVTVFSSKGGSGKSTIATNLALMLHRRTGQPTVLVDLDLQSGDLAIMLQLMPAWTIYDAADSPDRLDREALQGYLTPHQSGVTVLAAPLEPALADTISPDAVTTILELLHQMFPYVVVDGPGLFTDQILAAFDLSHEIVLMTSMDVPSVKNMKLSMHTFEQLGVVRDRLHLVLNRADSKVGLRLQEVERSLGTPVDVTIPSSREVPLSINQGRPLVEKGQSSEVVDAIQRLCERVELPAHKQTSRGRSRFLRRS